MFRTPQNEAVASHMLQLYQRGIQQDIAFETGQQQPYYLPTSIRLGPSMPAVVDGTARYHSYSGGVMSGDPCCTGCGSGSHCSGGAMVDYSRFVGGQGIKSLNGVEPSKAAGTQSYTTQKLDMSGGAAVVSQDLAYEMSGAPGFTSGLGIPKHDQEMESLPGVRRVHGGRRRMTAEEKKKWGQMMKEARQKKRGGQKEIHIDIDSHKGEPIEEKDEKEKKKRGGKKEIHVDIDSHKHEPNDDEKKTGGGPISGFLSKIVGAKTESPVDILKSANQTVLKKGSILGDTVRKVGSELLKSVGFGKSGGVKKYQKKTGGALQPVNTFTAKSSPVISGGRKKQWTAEERKAFAEKMKAAKAAKRQK